MNFFTCQNINCARVFTSFLLVCPNCCSSSLAASDGHFSKHKFYKGIICFILRGSKLKVVAENQKVLFTDCFKIAKGFARDNTKLSIIQLELFT